MVRLEVIVHQAKLSGDFVHSVKGVNEQDADEADDASEEDLEPL